ncbi:hypothetical protein M3Y97_01135600 [Aphelenchoides bicaudatus]|nr:hypothetical protein M3Y97_01135600 [Aphelenchoides bicaudatus]
MMMSYYQQEYPARNTQRDENEDVLRRHVVHVVSVVSTVCLILFHFFVCIPALVILFSCSIEVYHTREWSPSSSAMLTIAVSLSFIIVVVHILTAFCMLFGYFLKQPSLFMFYLVWTPITIVMFLLWIFGTFIYGLLYTRDATYEYYQHDTDYVGTNIIIASLSSILFFVGYVFFCFWAPKHSYDLLKKALNEVFVPPHETYRMDGRRVY